MKKDEVKQEKSGISLDWLIGGVLSKIGDTFDRFTGRNWNPSSSLATSKLVEKLKLLMDAEVRDLGKEGKFAPHVFTLKIQWNKFSTDSDDELKKLEYELHAAAIDHINDRLYHTYAPLEISVAKDYFVEGVRFTCGFGKFAEKPEDETEVHITLANIPAGSEGPVPAAEPPGSPEETVDEAPAPICAVSFAAGGRKRRKELDFGIQKRFSVGRGGSNDIVIDDQSVSKSHAAIALTREGKLVVADTGSTNGTFVGGRRIAYGKTVEIAQGSELKFGDVRLEIEFESFREIPKPPGDEPGAGLTEVISADEPAPTVASIPAESIPDEAETGSNEDWEI